MINCGRAMKRLMKSLLRRAGYQLSPITPLQSVNEQNADITNREWRIYHAVEPFTMVSIERILANIRAVDYIARNEIPGDFVECGVWRGGSAMAMALALKGHSPRTLWMYDTYAGLTDATSADISHSGADASAWMTAARHFEAQPISRTRLPAPIARQRQGG